RAVDGAEQPRIAGEHIADEKSAVAAALTGEPRRPGNAARDQVPGHRSKVIMGELLARSHAGLVPARTEFAAAANVGDDEHAAVLEPELADTRLVIGQARDLKSAVAGQEAQVRTVKRNFGAADLEIRNLLPVHRYRVMLRDHEPRCIEAGRSLLEHFGALAGASEP